MKANVLTTNSLFEKYIEVIESDPEFSAEDIRGIVQDLRAHRELLLFLTATYYSGVVTNEDAPKYVLFSRASPSAPIEADDDLDSIVTQLAEYGIRVVAHLYPSVPSWARH